MIGLAHWREHRHNSHERATYTHVQSFLIGHISWGVNAVRTAAPMLPATL